MSSPSSESSNASPLKTGEASAFITMKVTAYCPCEKCCGKYADGYTASGHKIERGDKFIAAPKSIPFGTLLEIPEYGTVPVLDRGGAVTVSRLDVFFDSHKEAQKWGVKYLRIRKVNTNE